MTEEHIHGFTAEEQDRLTRMQSILNQKQIAAMELSGVKRVLDVGAGLGQMTRVLGIFQVDAGGFRLMKNEDRSLPSSSFRLSTGLPSSIRMEIRTRP